MTTIDNKVFDAVDAAPEPALVRWWRRVETWLDRMSERLNPILVKESRQALKSRQFLVTFTIMLLCGWGWSLMGVALLASDVYYRAGGPFLLMGYYFVLGVPLIIVAPFSAFRSLAGEREDGTFELVSITNLSARQIVTGKLGSTLIQMLVYYSALAPCIAFTYLLRGVDVVMIGIVLAGTFIISLMLSALGLLMGALSRERSWQALLSVVVLLGLIVAGAIWSGIVMAMIDEGGPTGNDADEFWGVMGLLATMCGGYLALIILATAAQISFASDNRSTGIRVALLVQQVLWTAWMMGFWLLHKQEPFLLIYVIFAGIHWSIAGASLVGETQPISSRVQRNLPRRYWARVFTTWLNPGSGTAYVFTIANLMGVALTASVIALFAEFSGVANTGFGVSNFEVIGFAWMMVAYVAGYLGTGRLLTLALSRFYQFGLALPFLLNLLLAVMGAAFPSLLALSLSYGNPDYSELQITNWFWTLAESIDGRLMSHPLVIVSVLAYGAIMFLINLAMAAPETRLPAAAAPQRVLEDELEQHPERSYKPLVRTNPWDEPPADAWQS